MNTWYVFLWDVDATNVWLLRESKSLSSLRFELPVSILLRDSHIITNRCLFVECQVWLLMWSAEHLAPCNRLLMSQTNALGVERVVHRIIKQIGQTSCIDIGCFCQLMEEKGMIVVHAAHRPEILIAMVTQKGAKSITLILQRFDRFRDLFTADTVTLSSPDEHIDALKVRHCLLILTWTDTGDLRLDFLRKMEQW